ncbi:iron-sulfur cluster assembly scaffold protein [Rhizobiaceae bacterium BDR2-2]|uniref:Iron-sulfur cluster assembly scaffold protein n=1 Tax=Ectorhizobium quercum TaxID=2965071 RepID=A0AAE3N358_9HYPH|nr:iron-sulfur cluster assembly scaffold protein [Ectorhizobium quercum]MCX8997727.1 iron-sulfur cluster assembly scaffold protein [Ectorhizobium quercum]
MDEIYNAKILEFAGNLPLIGVLPDADGSAERQSKLCGSRIRVHVRLDGDTVTGFSHEVKACALGQASASIMARQVIGATVAEIAAARDAMLSMLKEGGEGPEGRFADMRFLKPVRDYKARHASTMLTFEATLGAIEAARAGRSLATGA